jgi:UDP-3-O-[3-hydroxymyristoyl] N-acetylglucosamine deacetylase
VQHTIQKTATLSGIGLHSGAETVLSIRPADAYQGISFVRKDVTDRINIIPARWDAVVDTRLCTVIGNAAAVTVGTIEHLMAALRACGIDNAVIELDGPEVPIMDGSSAPFIDAILKSGLKTQTAPRRAIKILKDIILEDGDKRVALKPSLGSRFRAEIDFPHPMIGRQSYEVEMLSDQFVTDIADARTFGFAHEVKALRAQGLALGGSLENAIVLDQTSIMNEEGLRYDDEFARHKVLDAVGDIYLAGAPIIGLYEAFKPGHFMNNQILRQMFATADAWTYIDLFIDMNVAPAPLETPALVARVQSAALA